MVCLFEDVLSAWKHFWVGSYDSNTSMSCLLSPSWRMTQVELDGCLADSPHSGVRFRVQQGDGGCRLAGGSSSLGRWFPLRAGSHGRADPNLPLKGYSSASCHIPLCFYRPSFCLPAFQPLCTAFHFLLARTDQ